MAVGQYIPLVLIVYLFIGSTEEMCIGISLEGSTVETLGVNCVSGYHGGTMKTCVALCSESIMTMSSSLEIIKEICEGCGQNIHCFDICTSGFVKQQFFMSQTSIHIAERC